MPHFAVKKDKLILIICAITAIIAICAIAFICFFKPTNSESTNEETKAEKQTVVAPITYPSDSPKSLEYKSLGDGTCSISSIGNYSGEDLQIPEKSPLGEKVVAIEAHAFENCLGLVSVTVPSSVTRIGEQAFKGCYSLVLIWVDSQNPKYYSSDGILYTKDKSRLICCPPSRIGSSYLIDPKVKAISDYAFYGVKNLTRIYYQGSTADFESIKIGKGNEDFSSLPITCNYIGAK